MKRPNQALYLRALPLVLPLLAAPAALGQVDQVEKSQIPQPSPGTEVFGAVIDFDGVTLVAGSPYYDVGSGDDGAAYVWDWGPGGLGSMTMLTSPSPSSGAHFGSDVAVDGDTLVIGEEHSDLFVNDGGAVHVYVRVAGAWTFQQTLTLASPAYFDSFGASVDLEANRLVVGGPYHGTNRYGGAWVFERVGGVWSQAAYLVSSDLSWGDQFGADVALSGDTVLVGVPMQGGGVIDGGAAYVFRAPGGAWGQEQKLGASPGSLSALFGISVDIEGDLLLVGATATNNSGAAYAFTRSGTAWSLEALLTAWSGGPNATFGDSVALDGDRAVVGAYQDTAQSFGEGTAYVFDRDGGAWTGVSRLFRIAGGIARHGRGTALSGDTIFVGATIAPPTGVIYEYEINNNVGSQFCTGVPNSTGAAAVLYATGSASVATNDLTLHSGPVPNGLGLFVYALNQTHIPFGNGVRCVKGSMRRLPPPSLGVGNEATHVLDLPNLPSPINPGDTWNFQHWYRDGGGGAGVNTSIGLEVFFTP
jgi:hypothetical protein